MPLRLLHRAVLEDSKNPVLREICYFLDRYNAMLAAHPAGVKNATSLDEQSSLLAGLFYRVAAYLTSKPPGGGRLKRQLRWTALTDLARQLTAEAARVGVKLVRSPDDFRKTAHDDKGSENMWLEVLDPYHRHGFDLSALYQKWLAAPGRKSFWETIGTPEEDEVSYFRGELGVVRFAGNRVVAGDGELYSTRDGSTVESGRGWQIFVVSPDGTLYIHDHAASEFHHTSFLGGGAVMAAGEIVVDQGVIRCLTAKTGHYWTTPPLMLNMVRKLHEIPADALVRPDVLEPKPPIKFNSWGEAEITDAADAMVFYRVGDFRRNGMRAKRLTRQEVDSHLPSFAWRKQVVASYH